MTRTVSIKDTRDKLADIVNHVETLRKVFGAWKNRKDIKNSAKWVANMRKRISLRSE